MRRHLLSSTNHLSPVFGGGGGGGGIAVGLLLHAALPIGDYTPPLWAWLAALLVVPGAGLVLHITMRRVPVEVSHRRGVKIRRADRVGASAGRSS